MSHDFAFENSEIRGNIGLLSILYVEDEEAIRASLSRMLKRRTENLTLAENGAEGLRKFKEVHPDIVITDIRMPGMDGLTMIERIREIDQNVPIIITTGHNDEQFFLRSIELGVDKYVKKPVDSKELLSTVSRLSQNVLQQKELEAKNQFILALLDINPSYLAILGDKGLIYLNQSFKRFLDVSTIEEFKSKYGELVPLIIDKDPELTDDAGLGKWAIEHASGVDSGYLLQFKLPQNDETQSFLLSTVLIPSNTREYLLTFTDITQLEKEKQHYQYLAEYDALTRVFNRSKINKEMDKEITRVLRYRQRLSVLMIDVDHFKKVNDTYGHQVGDIVLIELSALIQDRIRKTDILGRYGGEEFILLMPSTPIDSAAEIADRLRKHIAAYSFTGVGHVTCSIGVAEYQPGESASNFIKRSDDALYLAKRNGRNRIETSA